jgi:hypothetical protein
MRNYWTCGKVADWIRGTPTGGAKSSEEWNEWTKQAKKSKIRYWLAENVLGKTEDIVKYIPERINDIRYYLNNRYMIRSNSLTAHKDDIKPGQWCDVGSRFLPCMFNELVDFVEIESAWMHVCFSDESREQYNLPWWRKQWYTRWFMQWRNAEAGVAHLEWASSLKYDEHMGIEPGQKHYGESTAQAINAKEILALYRWWKEVYKKRPDVYDVCGWTAYCERKREAEPDNWVFSGKKTKEEQKEVSKMLKEMHKMEDDYAKEDEEMMIRLIKVRDSLWT